ncbi:tRNA pseudouridine synthase B [Nymphon striatum]|nr:tRNA pseudouridine synthase B [Nymphon striatum]
MSGLLKPELREELIGIAEVKDAKSRKSSQFRVLRKDVVIYEGYLESLRRHQDDVKEVAMGTECGIGVKNYDDVQPGDQIESLAKQARDTDMPYDYSRTDRIGEQIKRELSMLIRNEIKDPRVSMPKVYFDALNQDEHEACEKGLNNAAGFLRRELGLAIKLRNTPSLTFIYDDTEQKANDLSVLIDKAPIGRSSNSALQKVRYLFQAKKAGHTGSLDPLATGVLPICFGQASKVTPYLLDSDKSYRCTAQLGETTTTGDKEGETLQVREVTAFTEKDVEAVLRIFQG